jgi:integrase
VGNSKCFNSQGAVPTNFTQRDVLGAAAENDWHTWEDIYLLTSLSALLHDLGKASAAFQARLRNELKGRNQYRHEWASLRILEAFVGKDDDATWLTRLKGCVSHLKKHLGPTLLPNLNEKALHGYIRARQGEGACGRTINMDLGTLSRAIGTPWRTLWPNLRKLEERADVGRAISPEEERKLLNAVPKSRSPFIGTFISVALLTGMRCGEIISLTWAQVDLSKRVITVGRAKTSSGTGRQIPMNGELETLLAAHFQWFTNRFGEAREGHYVFPWGSPFPTDPTRSATTIKKAWENLRTKAGVSCRLHDLRHTAATKMAEAGIPESTMLSLMGHMSRAMLELYSHIRMAAKREAVESLSLIARIPTTRPKTEVVRVQ